MRLHPQWLDIGNYLQHLDGRGAIYVSKDKQKVPLESLGMSNHSTISQLSPKISVPYKDIGRISLKHKILNISNLTISFRILDHSLPFFNDPSQALVGLGAVRPCIAGCIQKDLILMLRASIGNLKFKEKKPSKA